LALNTDLPTLSVLVGEELSSIIFVADYVQFDFNGPRLTAFSPPVVRLRGGESRFPGPGSRDALCSLIQQVVASAIARQDDRIDVTFASGARLSILLGAGQYEGPEAATFSDPNAGGLLVW